MFLHLLIFIVLLQRCDGSVDIKWYREEMTAKVVPVYQAAYKTLNDDIIQPILDFNDTFNETENLQITTVHSEENEHYRDMHTAEEVTVESVTFQQSAYDITTILNMDHDVEIKIEHIDEQTTQNTSWNNDNVADDSEIHSISETHTEEEHSENKNNHFEDWNLFSKESIDSETHQTINKIKPLIEDIENHHFQLDTLNDTDSLFTTEINHVDGVVSDLKHINEEDNPLKTLVEKIRTAARGVYKNLKNASSECERLRTKLNGEIAVAVIDISKQEDLCREVNTTIDQLTSGIQYHEKQVSFAEQVVREGEEAVSRADRELREAEDRVEKARLCRGKRRRKRFIGGGGGGWWSTNIEKPTNNFVQQHIEKPLTPIVHAVIVKPVCSVVNMGGIDIAKEGRSSAGRMLDQAKDRLSNEKQRLSEKRSELAGAIVKRAAAERRRQVLTLELAELRKKYVVISSFTEKFLNVSTHVATVLGSSRTLNTAIKRLLDFELVIVPLNALAEGMIKDELMPVFGFEISANTIATVDYILERISKKLERLSILTDENEFTTAIMEDF